MIPFERNRKCSAFKHFVISSPLAARLATTPAQSHALLPFCGGGEALVCWSGFEIISCFLDLEADSSKASAELWLLRSDGWRSGIGLFTQFSLLFCTSKNQSITSVVQRLDHLIQSCHLLISGIALVLFAM